MENVMSNEERNKIINMYSIRLNRCSGELGRYYAEIVDNMTWEDAKTLLELGSKYGFINHGDSFKAAFKVILVYVGQFFKEFNAFNFKKTMSDFGDNYYEFLSAQVAYYGNLIEELRDRDNISSIMARSICQCLSERYLEFASMPLLNKLNKYLTDCANDLLKCKLEYEYNNLSYTKRSRTKRHYKQWLSYGNDQLNPNFVGDNK